MTTVTYTAQSSNSKTGNIPQIWIGGNLEESKGSCDKVQCPLRPWAKAEGAVACYAWSGSSQLGFGAALRNPDQLTLEQAVERRVFSAKAIRAGAIGDPGVLPKAWWKKLYAVAGKHRLSVLSYTHGWRQRPDLAGKTMASCESLEEAVQAKQMGFQVAVVLPPEHSSKTFKLPDGTRGVVCPNMQMKADSKVPRQCNDCLLCTGDKDVTIGFPAHGPGVKRKK